MSIEVMKQALDALEADEQDMVADKDGHMVFRVDVAITALRQAIEQAEQAQFVANEVQLNIIRWWPDGFANRLEHVWKDLIGFTPNYKLYDLQRMMAEFGFTMKLYEGDAPPSRKPLTDEEIVSVANTVDGFGVIKQRDMNFARAICSVYGTAAFSEANARLIAAAPDLLSALDDLARYADTCELFLRETHPGKADMLRKRVTAAIDAMAKATGGEG